MVSAIGGLGRKAAGAGATARSGRARELTGRRGGRAQVRLPRWLRRGPRFDLEPHVRQEATGILLVMLATLLAVSLVSGGGWLSGLIARPLVRWLGWGAWGLSLSGRQ